MKKWLNKRVVLGMLALTLVVSGGLSAAPKQADARMSAIPTPCDGFGDCIATAWWYAFYR